MLHDDLGDAPNAWSIGEVQLCMMIDEKVISR